MRVVRGGFKDSPLDDRIGGDMGFCTITDVQGYTGRVYSSSTVPTLTQVESIIEDRSMELYAILQKHDLVYADLGTNAKALLGVINAKGAACDAERHTYKDAVRLPDNVRDLCEYVRSWMERLSGDGKYLDDSLIDSHKFRSRFTTGVTASDANDTPTAGNQNAEFRKGDKW